MIHRRFLALAFAAIVSMRVPQLGLFEGVAEQPAGSIELYETFLNDMLVGIPAGLEIPEELIVAGQWWRRREIGSDDRLRVSLMSDPSIRLMVYGNTYDLIGRTRAIGTA